MLGRSLPFVSTGNADIDRAFETWRALLGPLVQKQLVTVVSAPATSTSPGDSGQIAYDSGHLYVCIAPGNWVRAAFGSW
jgi:hypothetical protein